MQNMRVPAQAALNSLVKVAVAGGLGVYGVSNSIFNVEGGHRAIIFNRVTGIKDTVRRGGARARRVALTLGVGCAQVYPEGTHLMVPWFERPIIYDVRAQPNIVQSTSGSRDLQMVRPARGSGAGCVRASRSLAAAARRAPAVWRRQS
jgi:prohibitin 2